MFVEMGNHQEIEARPFTIRDVVLEIQIVVGEQCGVNLTQMLGECRDAEYVRARQICFLLCREFTPYSTPEIGRLFNRDHTTVIWGYQKMRRLIKEMPSFANDIEILRARIKANISGGLDAEEDTWKPLGEVAKSVVRKLTPEKDKQSGKQHERASAD